MDADAHASLFSPLLSAEPPTLNDWNDLVNMDLCTALYCTVLYPCCIRGARVRVRVRKYMLYLQHLRAKRSVPILKPSSIFRFSQGCFG